MPVHSSDGDFLTAEDGERYLAPEVPVGWASREEEENFPRRASTDKIMRLQAENKTAHLRQRVHFSVNHGSERSRYSCRVNEALMLGTAEQRHAAAATVAAIQSSRLSDLLESFFFVNSGSEVVEAALKVARSIMRRQNIITMQGTYHRWTFGAMAITRSKAVWDS